jgi:5-methylcytosine-specific restriction enzyme A
MVVYRYLTDNEFFHIYKPAGTEPSGGGQKYIDFSTTQVSVEQWDRFFSEVRGLIRGMRTKGPSWEIPVLSAGLSRAGNVQEVTVFQRRKSSVCIAAQNINSRKSARVPAWHPKNGFPEPGEPTERQAVPEGLAVYLVRTTSGEVWAGWFINGDAGKLPVRDIESKKSLSPMLDPARSAGDAGILEFHDGVLFLEETDGEVPFLSEKASLAALVQTGAQHPLLPSERTQQLLRKKRRRREKPITRQRRTRTEEEIADALFDRDEDYEENDTPKAREQTVRVRQRNTRAVRELKKLYRHRCQVTGELYIFPKRNGTNYTEAHHLLPLGEGGADDPRNIIIVSPLIHCMLHYANVSGIDLTKIEEQEDGSALLQIEINGQSCAIQWLPRHARSVRQHEQEE